MKQRRLLSLMLPVVACAAVLAFTGRAAGQLSPRISAAVAGLRLDGTQGDENFGLSVAALGDVNGDGVCDIAVGAPAYWVYGPGRARVYSAADWSLIGTVNGESDDDWFGRSVAAPGDVNGDGRADILVGAPWADPGGRGDAGAAYLYSGADFTLIKRFEGVTAYDHLGFCVANAGDVNGDGVADLLIGAPYADRGGYSNAGAAYLYSGADRSLIAEWPNPAPAQDDHFGWSVAGAGDVNEDGVPDILVGAPYDDPGGRTMLEAYMFSPARPGH